MAPIIDLEFNGCYQCGTMERRGAFRGTDLLSLLLVVAGLCVLAVTFWPSPPAAEGEPEALPSWDRDPRPIDLASLAAAPGLTFPPGMVPFAAAAADDDAPPLLALFVLNARSCSALYGDVVDYAAELAARWPGRAEPLALVLDPSRERARRFGLAASLPMPLASGWDEAWSEELGRFREHRQLLEQLVLIDRRRGVIAGRILLSTALTPVETKRRLLAAVLDTDPSPAAADESERRNTR